MIERAARLLNQGGPTGRANGLDYVVNLLLEPARKMRLLVAIYESSLRAEFDARLMDLMKIWIADTPTAAEVHPDSKNPALVMRAVTNLFYRVRDSELAAEIKGPLTGHLDTVLHKYIVQAQILEKVDDPARPLRQRARMLMSMCLPDMLPPGKAVEAARPRVIAYLRQPNFTTEVVADIADPVEREKTLREFFDLMRKAGFK
jgi:hypothetical protein